MDLERIITLPSPRDGFEYSAPNGSNVYFIWGKGQKIPSQVLAETLKANTKYMLQMDFCVRSDEEPPIQSMLALGYGTGGPDSGVLLKGITTGHPGATTPARGTYETWTLVYQTDDSPAGLGKPLWIQLGATRKANFTEASAAYDNIRLYAVPVPEDLSR